MFVDLTRIGLVMRQCQFRFRAVGTSPLAHENILMGLALDHMLMGMEPDPDPTELKSSSGQHIRTSEFDPAKWKISKMFENHRIWTFRG